MMPWRGRRIAVIVALGTFGLALAGRFVGLYVDYLWFESLGYTQVFFTGLWAGLALWAAGTGVFLLIFVPNVLIAQRAARRFIRRAPERVEPPRSFGPFGAAFGTMGIGGSPFGGPFGGGGPRSFGDVSASLGGTDIARWLLSAGGRPLLVYLGLALALVMGLWAATGWQTVLRAINGGPFDVADPIFGYDVGFHVFMLPLLDFFQSWLFWSVLLVAAAVGALYALALYVVDPAFERVTFFISGWARGLRTHLLLLGAVLLLVLAFGFWIGMFDVLLNVHDRLVGARFADVNVRLPATQALIAATILTALLTVVSTFRRGYVLPLAGIVLMAASFFIGRGILPVIVQRVQVEPAELVQEEPYIRHSIAFTRRAFGLDRIVEQTFPAEEAVTPAAIRADPDTVRNIRLWDPRPLQDTFNQIQSIRPYYVFSDVDVDRYRIDGRRRQVMLSARELVVSRLGASAQTWVNRRLQFTHGYGVAMIPVTEITPEGLPTLLVRDLPPAGRLTINRPEIYYGEQTGSYVIVNTLAEEFDYPLGDQNVFTTYAGESGVQVGSFARRALLAWFFGDFNLLVSNYVTPQSQVLFRRLIHERVQRIVPFAKLDRDPYLVTADGALYWILDGYTLADRYPYSLSIAERLATATAEGDPTAAQPAASPMIPSRRYVYNYIRNSVKVTVNAYDGSMRVYLADPADPVAATYARIYPGLFRALEEMPASLREHIRYPEDLFRVQAQVLRSYHVQDPRVFYNGEDVWSLAFEAGVDQRQIVEPYYLIMRLPGEEAAEFILVTPFTPMRRDNLTGWLAARNDVPHYGQLYLYKFPRDRLIFGPGQISARINQDAVISQQLTLWDQQGSRVRRGNLLVVPIGNSTLYVQPIYLEADQGRLPELKRVILATGNRVVMEPSLGQALQRLFGQDLDLPPEMFVSSETPGTVPGVAPVPGAPPAPGAPAPSPPQDPALAATVQNARDAYTRAQEALRAGDFARFGEELRRLETILAELERAANP